MTNVNLSLIDKFKAASGNYRDDCETILLDEAISIIHQHQAELPQDVVEALKFYADTSKYVAPFTGGLGELYFDCGQKAKEAINVMGDAPVNGSTPPASEPIERRVDMVDGQRVAYLKHEDETEEKYKERMFSMGDALSGSATTGDKVATEDALLPSPASDPLIAFLKELVDSDIAMREEDEGNVSPLLEEARALISQYDNGLDEKQGENRAINTHGVPSEIRVNESDLETLMLDVYNAEANAKNCPREDIKAMIEAIRPYLRTTEPRILDIKKLRDAVRKDACWQHKDDCICDHVQGADSAFDYLSENGYLRTPEPVMGDVLPRQPISSLLNEIDCRIEHGAESNGHLNYVHKALKKILEGS